MPALTDGDLADFAARQPSRRRWPTGGTCRTTLQAAVLAERVGLLPAARS